jgi:hypothetical protein
MIAMGLGLDKEIVAPYLSVFVFRRLASVKGRSAQHAYGFRPERRCGSQVVYH